MLVSRRRLLANIALCSGLLSFPRLGTAQAAGGFKGHVAARWADNGRDMILTEPFEYVAPDGRRWPVPRGTTVDGASIPRFFWSTIGGPFDGLYRNASVVHDFYCQVRTRTYEDVHRVFYDAMKTSGVTDAKGWLMYQAVLRFGPRWRDPKIDPKCEIVDDNYDFKFCARNFAKPPVEQPGLDRSGVEEFLKSLDARADQGDIAALQAALTQLR